MTRTRRDITPLLEPASIALLGASDDPTRIGGRPLRYLREAGFKGRIYPVNPNRELVQGMRAYKTLADLPEAPELVLVALPANLTVGALGDAAARGAKAAIVFSAGFAETGTIGAALQEEIAAIAASTGMRVLGPNCLGAFNAELGYFGTFTQSMDRAFPKPGNIAVVSQSGAYGSHIAYLARERGMGVKYWITTGNEVDVDVAESLLWLVRRPDVSVVMAYAEGIRDQDTFVAALGYARRHRKAIVFMKVGRSAIGAEAAASHTAALAGADAIYDAVFRQFGVHRARTTAEQLDVAYACSRGIYPAGNKLGIITLSGGMGVQMADAADEAGLDVAPMPLDAQAELQALLPFATPRNPVDVTAQALNDMQLLSANMQMMLERGGYDAIIGIFSSVPSTRTLSDPLRKALHDGSRGYADRLFVLTMAASREIVAGYEAAGFLVFEDNNHAITALAAITGIGRSFAAAAEAVDAPPASDTAIPEGPMGEHASKALLAKAGIPVAIEHLARTPDDAADAADQIGYPVVLKIASIDIPHKTEIGGVLLAVTNAAAVRAGVALLIERARAARPDARLDGVLVSPMLSGGVETILGVHRDPVFGAVVMFGIGGIFVEVMKDVTFRMAPFGVEEARRMIREIKGASLLDGVRGQGAADIDALAEALAALSRFAAANAGSIASVDVNPFLVMPKGRGAVALDALVVGG